MSAYPDRMHLILRFALLLGLVVAVVTPLLLLVMLSLGGPWFYPRILPDGLDPGVWSDILSGAHRLAPAAINSILLGVAVGVFAAAAGFVVGRALAELDGWRRSVGAAAAFLPVAAPPIALATGLQISFLSIGLGATATGVMLAHLIPAAGYTSLFFLGVFSLYDAQLELEAQALGAGRSKTLLEVTLPLLKRPLIEAAVLGFLVSWAQVPLTLLIGQGLVATLPVEVLAYVQAGQDRYAAAGALLLIIPPITMLTLAGVAIRRSETVPA